ncbi:MAG TPA: LytR C-terminal domain-containing protein [Sphingomicrobium sp.]|nr:LytR C-terminal domain-containing protein [Sphingomicrobium sp.]
MRTGAKIVIALSFTVASCTAPAPQTKIRSVGALPSSGDVAVGEAELGVGNVALAMETFRKAIRDNPADVRALRGLALSYQRMGRLDLSRKWLETALATAPDSPQLLNDLADVLDLQGERDKAALVRAEADVNAKLIAATTERALTRSKTRLPEVMATSSVTVVLPAPAPAPAELAPTVARNSRPPIAPLPANQNGPRLERLSLGEVALVTTGRTLWASLDQRSGERMAVQFVPLQQPARLLNAARVEGLAARTRQSLLGKGWKKIEIGDAPAVRERTLVLYPAQDRARAERLVAQLGVGSVQPSFAGRITVLLGRDIARSAARRPA